MNIPRKSNPCSATGVALVYTIALAALLVFAPSASQAAQATTKPSQAAPHLEVTVDPRIELLAAVQSVSDWEKFGTQNGAWAKPGNPYRRDMEAWFAPYRNHPAVTQFNKLLAAGFGFDAPVNWILHYDAPPLLKQRAPLDEETLRRAGGQAKVDALAAAFRDFARTSHFREFFNKHKPLYDQLVASYRKISPDDSALALIERFYGERRAGYTVNIAPMFGGANYGGHVSEGKDEHIYDTGAPLYKNSQYVYRKSWQMNLMFHEFSHSFTNPAVDSDRGRYGKYEYLFPAIRYKMEPQGYGVWDDVVVELMNRTNEIRLVQLYGDAATADTLEKDYIKGGFLWLPYTLGRLKEYEANRGKYPTYRLFIDRMFDVLDETSPVIKEGKMVDVVPKTVGFGS